MALHPADGVRPTFWAGPGPQVRADIRNCCGLPEETCSTAVCQEDDVIGLTIILLRILMIGTRDTWVNRLVAGPEITLTTDLPELGLPMIYFEAAKLFPNDGPARRTAILVRVVGLAAMVQPWEEAVPFMKLTEEGESTRAEIFARVESLFKELGGFRALSLALCQIVEHGGKITPASKGPGSLYYPAFPRYGGISVTRGADSARYFRAIAAAERAQDGRRDG